MSQARTVSIGITCYNARETIGRAIASALAQDYPELEVLIADDASTDGSADVVDDLISDESRAQLIRLERNGGPAVARNAIIAAASGEFLAFFDDDDESLPGRVSAQVAAIEAFESSHPDVPVACYAGGERLYPNGYRKLLPAIGADDIRPHGPALADYLLFHRKLTGWRYNSGTPTCALMARTDVLRQFGGFDTGLRRVEDVDLAIRLALSGGWFIGTKETLFVQHATTGADKSYEKNRDAEVAIADKHEGYLRSIRRYHYARNWPVLRYYHFKRDYLRFALQFVRIWLVNPVLATEHILATGPKRLAHERRMKTEA
ncbi:glycosyltransferase [Devosia sp. XJ19-1]|uniref:Glycosyltransferase n=1 Tax=Devosia ureilytica TaxID=2952754 RepID=A0A9Q4AKB3_9HYPH|nr:glycosyltransferase [Devosia ureilytica]MCP8882614.1 glycosyltransferase [Devosia ureilytica]MCP8885499.1 glycosyltransferase [Devosia ureilytica]